MLLPLLQNNLLQGGSDVEVGASTASLSLTTYAATVSYDVNVAVDAASLTLSTAAATVALNVAVNASAAALTLSPKKAAVSYDVNVSAATEALALTTYPATIDSGEVAVNVGVATLSITTYPATVQGLAAAAQKGAGSKKRRSTKYFAEINGEPVVFNTFQEARAYFQAELAKARESASSQTDRQSKRIRRGKKVLVEAPVITKPSEAIQSLVSDYREDMESIYRQIAIDAELRELMRRKMMEEDEEDALFVLLH